MIMKETSKTEMALESLKKNRKQLRSQLSDLESELIFCYLPGKMKDNLINSVLDAIEVLDEEIHNLEEQQMFQALNQGLGIK
jgi:chromosome segregation ATPase